MKSIPLLLVALTVAIGARAQSADSVIYAVGTITNHTTKEMVSARISYQSLPFGNIVGTLSGSEFSIPLYGNEKYSVTVEAPGFAPAKYMLDPATAVNGKVTQNIEFVADADQANTAFFKINIDPTGAGIQRIFQQFLDHRRGALDHFARGNLIDQGVWQQLNRHARVIHIEGTRMISPVHLLDATIEWVASETQGLRHPESADGRRL